MLMGPRVGTGQEGSPPCNTFCPFLVPQVTIMSASGDGTRGPPKSKGKVREQRGDPTRDPGKVTPVSTHAASTHPIQTLSSFFGSLPGFSSARNLMSHTHSSTKDVGSVTDPTGTPVPSSPGEGHKGGGRNGAAMQTAQEGPVAILLTLCLRYLIRWGS